LNIILMLADAAANAPTTGGGDAPGWFNIFKSPVVPLALGLIVLMLFMNRSKNSQEKNRQEMLKQLKRGDRVQTVGGILGSVLRAEENRVEVKVDETNNTKIWFARSAIQRVVEAEKSDVK
jgi:preprotein translocase subunit YajC